MKRYIAYTTVSVLAAFTLLGGCGSDSDTATTQTGYFIDAPVAGLAYQTASGLTGTTDEYGRFQYRENETVRFTIGKLDLGETTPPADGLVTPATLAGGDQTVETTMLRLIQSLDIDDDPTNGIVIPDYIVDALNTLTQEVSITSLTSDAEILNLNTTLAEAIDENYDGIIDVTALQAQTHFESSLQQWANGIKPDMNTSLYPGYGTGYGPSTNQQQGGLIDVSLYPMSELNDDEKYTLAYMWNEEKLAKDIYLALNALYPTAQFENIATRSETTHQANVEALLQKYDLNITNPTDYTEHYSAQELLAYGPGEYTLPEIKELYDALYTKGQQSQIDALQVGCMVEVTDINDLDQDIEIAQETNATDIIAVYENLRSGSYNHYWAFDNALKVLGVAEGCASAGPDYAKTEEEYPKTH